MKLGYAVPFLLLATATAVDSMIAAGAVVTEPPAQTSDSSPAMNSQGDTVSQPDGNVNNNNAGAGSYPSQPDYVMGSICNSAIPLDAPTVGNPILVEGRQTGHYNFPQCVNYVQYGGPAAAYRLIGTGDVLEVTTFQGPDYQQSTVTVYRGCVEGGGDQPYPYPADSSNSGGETSATAGDDSSATGEAPAAATDDNTDDDAVSGTNSDSTTTTKMVDGPEDGTSTTTSTTTSTEVGPPADSTTFSTTTDATDNTPPEDTSSSQTSDSGGGGTAPEGSMVPPPPSPNPDSHCVEGQSYDGARWKTEPGEEYTIIVHGSYQDPSEFVLSVAAFTASSVCGDKNPSVPIKLGEVSLKKPISTVGTTYGAPFLTDLPNCDPTSSSLSPTAIYLVEVVNPNTLVSATVGGDGQLSIYQGGCNVGGWTCAPTFQQHNNYPSPVMASTPAEGGTSGNSSTTTTTAADTTSTSGATIPTAPAAISSTSGVETISSSPAETTSTTGVATISSPPPETTITTGVATISSSPGFGNAQELSWHNARRKTSYLLAVYKCCGSQAIGDHLLSVSVSTYGNLCKDVTAASMLNFTDSSSLAGQKVFSGLTSCSDKSPLVTPTAFYSFTGTGDIVLATINNANSFTAQLALYSVASCNSSAPACLAFDDYSQTLFAPTVKGQKYYLAVYTSYSLSGEGNFTVAINSVSYQDLCTATMDVGTITKAKTIEVSNTTTGASYITNLNGCNTGAVQSPALAYSFTAGEDGILSVTLKSPVSFTQQFTVFEGSCDNPICNSEQYFSCNTDYCGMTQRAQADKKYFVVIYGSGPSQSGPFALSLEISEVGDVCADAVAIDNLADGLEIKGSTKGASQYQVNSNGCAPSTNSPSKIYYIDSTDEQWITVSVKSDQMSPTLYVLQDPSSQGECSGQFSCTDGGSNNNGWSWKAMAGTRYYLVVYGCCDVLQTGDFTLQFNVKEKGDICKAVDDLGSIKQGGLTYPVAMVNNSTEFYDLINCYYSVYASSPSAIFSFTAGFTGKMAVMIRFVTNSDKLVSVYTGSCDSLTCVGGTDSYSPFAFDVQEGTVYHIVLSYSSTYGYASSGNLVLVLEPVPEGNVCNDAQDLGSLGADGLIKVDSTTGKGLFSTLPVCYTSLVSPTAIYTFTVAEGGKYSIKARSATSSSTVAVFTGACDGWLQCFGDNSGSGVIVSAAQGEKLYLAVSLCCDMTAAGDFFLEMQMMKEADECVNATDLGSLTEAGSLQFGSTSSSGIYPNLLDYLNSPINSRVKIYTVTASTTGLMHAAVLSADTNDWVPQVTVMQGSCGGLQVAGVNQYSSSDVTWAATEGPTYYLVVYSYDSSQSGDFVLSVEATSPGSICNDAEDLGVLPITGLLKAGSIDHQSAYYSNLASCYDDVKSRAKVYKLSTKGQRISARVLSNDFDARISVYRGSCDADPMECAAYSNYRTATVDTIVGETLYVVVYGCCGLEVSGDFVIRITGVPRLTVCYDVMDLGKLLGNGGVVEKGSTNDGGVFPNITQCSTYYNSSLAEMYSVTGTGDTFVATAVGEASFSPQLIVYQGSCDNLLCLEFLNLGNGAVWNTVDGQQYFILVSSGSDSSGDYLISINTTVAGDVCGDVEDLGSIPENALLLTGATEDMSFYPDLKTCYDTPASSSGKFYSISTSSPGTVAVSVDSSGFDVQVSVYQGDCNGELTCVRGDSAKNVQFDAEPDTLYYVAVYGSGQSSGNFFLRIEVIPAGNLCNNSIPVESIPEKGLSLTGSTADGRIYSNLPMCYGYDLTKSPALTYSVGGTGGIITASISNSLIGDYTSPQLVVYGDDCGSPQCFDNLIAGYNQVTWSSVLNTAYFLAVSACCDSQSKLQFELALKLIDSADLCSEAISLGTIGAFGVTKTNSFKGQYYYPALSYCSAMDLSQSVTGYSMVGTGDVFAAEVSSGSKISIVSGNCSSEITCLGGYGYETSLSWATAANVTYYIVVFGTEAMNYTLTVKPISTSSTCNDKSDGVTNLKKIPPEGLVVKGSTVNGPIFRGISPCVNADPRGLWTPSAAFKLEGDGGVYFIFVEEASGFSPQIFGFEGDCGDLQCATNKTYGQSMVLTTRVKTTYTVIVNDCCMNQSGTFNLRTESAPEGDLKKDAVDIKIPASGLWINGSTVDGKMYDLPTCYLDISGLGSAYKVHTGTGGWTASVTGLNTGAQISAYTVDEKNGPVCYGLNDWGQVSWTADKPDQVVYILIYSSDLYTNGDYSLRIRNSTAGSSNLCDEVIDLGSVKEEGVLRMDSVVGNYSTFDSSNCSYGTDYPSENVAVALYKVKGSGGQLTASAFIPTSGLDVFVIPLMGRCGAFECIPDATSQSSRVVSWTGEADKTYYIMVTTCCGKGTFVLSVQDSSAPSEPNSNAAPGQHLRK